MTGNIARQPRGIPAGGQFSAAPHAEPAVALTGYRAPLPAIPDTGYRGAHSRLPEHRPEGYAFGDEEMADLVVASVMDGPLSRGVVNRARRDAFNAWHEWAQERALATQDPAYHQFAAGLRTGIAALYERRMDHYEPGPDRFELNGAPVYVADHALQLSGSKRTSAEDREHWRLLLQHTPTDAWYRGHLLAGVTLSGADSYWGATNGPDAMVTGRR